MTSRYATRLYELLIAWRNTGKTPIFQIDNFRQQLGVAEDEYTRSDNFKRRVLEIAISQINTFTDITVKLEQHKTGRSISGYSFTFKAKAHPKVIQNNAERDLPIKISGKQIELFSNKLAHDLTFASKYSEVGESYEDFSKRISEHLTNPAKVKEYAPYLKQLGFK